MWARCLSLWYSGLDYRSTTKGYVKKTQITNYLKNVTISEVEF